MPEPPFSSAHRIGFFGGSFDPIHQGHVSVALEAVNKFNLQQILLCPAYFAPLRDQRPLFPAAHRLGMVHTDLKLENIMIGSLGEVYVVDWDLALAVDPTLPLDIPLAEHEVEVPLCARSIRAELDRPQWHEEEVGS